MKEKPEVPEVNPNEITSQDAQELINFLDSSDCKGHATRNCMNLLCNKLIHILNSSGTKK